MTRLTRQLREQAGLWRVRLGEGLSATEKERFEEWAAAEPAHREALAEAEMFWEAMAQPDVHAQLRPLRESNRKDRQALEQTEPAPANPPPAGVLAGLSHKVIGASLAFAASVAVFFAGGGASLFEEVAEPAPQVFATKMGATQTITLEDRSRVTLGALSQMSLTLTPHARTVELSGGTAFFDVAKNDTRPFFVRTDLGEVRVTGTRFDVQVRADETVVAVAEGSVQVSGVQEGGAASEVRTVELSENQAIEISRAGGLGGVYTVFPAETGAWRKGRLIYVRKSLGLIVEDLNRYTDRPIRVSEDVRGLELSGAYDARNIQGVLEALEDALPIRLIADGSDWQLVSE